MEFLLLTDQQSGLFPEFRRMSLRVGSICQGSAHRKQEENSSIFPLLLPLVFLEGTDSMTGMRLDPGVWEREEKRVLSVELLALGASVGSSQVYVHMASAFRQLP